MVGAEDKTTGHVKAEYSSDKEIGTEEDSAEKWILPLQ
jgi:hypothetical protein